MSDEQTARTILEMHGIEARDYSPQPNACVRGPCRLSVESATNDLERLVDAICVALNQARTPPPGHIVDDQGVVRRVKGDFPILADGTIVAIGEEVWHPDGEHTLRVGEYDGFTTDHDDKPLPDGCKFWGLYSYFERDTGYRDFEMYDVRQCYSTREAAQAAKESK